MGCDIHGFIEVKYKGKWLTYTEIISDRSYTLFGILAGVRDDIIKPVSEQKGLPQDCSEIVKIMFDFWKEDAHSTTWLSKQEMFEAYNRLRELTNRYSDKEKETEENFWVKYGINSLVYQLYYFGWGFIEEMELFTDVRMVIWFDN